MPAKNPDLHGNAPDRSSVALLLIDVLNTMEFPEAGALRRCARPMAVRLAELKRSFKAKGVPVIYANDNFGKWKSEKKKLIERCMSPVCLGKEIVEALLPGDDDYFVLKPKHSAFFSTTLDTLLVYLGVRTLIIGGMAGNICVLHTAMDAHLRDYSLIVPADCVASNTVRENRFALTQLRSVMGADIRTSDHWIRAVRRGKRFVRSA